MGDVPIVLSVDTTGSQYIPIPANHGIPTQANFSINKANMQYFFIEGLLICHHRHMLKLLICQVGHMFCT